MNLSLPFALLTLASTSFVSNTSEHASPATAPATVAFGSTDSDCLIPGQRITYTVTLPAGQLSLVTVAGSGHSDLDLYIFDASGNLVDKDDDTTDFCVASVVPRRTGTFRIVVANAGQRSDCFKVTLD